MGNFAALTVAKDYVICSLLRWYNFALPSLDAVVALLWVLASPSTRFRPAPPLLGI